MELLPTPVARDYKDSHSSQRMANKSKLGGIYYLLRSPTRSDAGTGQPTVKRAANGHQINLADQVQDFARDTNWGPYEPAIKRWEGLTRLVPSPTETNSNGRPRLSAAFSEWMMGFPKGWVTDLIGNWRQPDQISRTAALKAIGNAVVPQQAIAALTELLEES